MGSLRTFYPSDDLPEDKRILLQEIDEEMNDFVTLVLNHTNRSLKGKKLGELFPVEARQPHVLQQLYQQWKDYPRLIERAPPTLVFAIMGQAKSDNKIDAGDESSILSQQLRNWAFNRKY